MHVWSRFSAVLLAMWLVACGGSSNDPPVNQAPVPRIVAPANGALFNAGQILAVTVDASDAEDGTVPTSRLTWWAELHHDTHVHPFQPETTGSGGSITIPTRGETSDNIHYRIHLRATDSAGRSTEVTRDVLPHKARVTLLTQPAGLALTLDGQPVSGGFVFTGVVGIERDPGAVDQIAAGRRYRFASWSDGGAPAHTLPTPAADTPLTATFVDIGSATNQPPTVSLNAPATVSTGIAVKLAATAADSDGSIASVASVAFYDGSTLLGTDTAAPFTWAWTPGAAGSHSLTARATDDGGAVTTSAMAVVTVTTPAADTQPPTISITAPAAFASALAGTVVVTGTATDNVAVASVEFQIDGVALGAALTVPPYSVNLDTTAHASGQHVLRARAADAAGNVSAWTGLTVQLSGTRTQPAGITRNESWITGLSSATAIAQAPDGRLVIAQQGGALRVVKNAALLTTPFLTVTVDPSGERGLLGVAFHPNFAANGYVYVYYTTTENGTHNRISRFTANGDVVLAGSELKLIDLPTLSGATNHNGGALHFGADGKLYVGVGENAQPNLAPDLSSPSGKLLRFNDDGSIPSDNPHVSTQTGLARAIWSRGLRNPFTFAVQPGTGLFHINDVGQNTWEEINVGAPRADYGWPASEGPDNVTASRSGPLHAYKHSAAAPAGSGPGGFFIGFAIAGGAFYPATGTLGAPWRGSYFIADYVNRFIGALDMANGNVAYAFSSVSGSPVDVLAAADGALLVLTRGGIVRFSAP